jgi:hypothetical protein
MLNDNVLIVNQNYEPLITTSVKRAIVLVFLGKASMVEARGANGSFGQPCFGHRWRLEIYACPAEASDA